MKSDIFEKFGKAFVFKKIRPYIRAYYKKAGYDEVPYAFFGILFYVTLFFTAVFYVWKVYPVIESRSSVIILFFTFFSWFVIQSLMIIFSVTVIYFNLNRRIYKRTKEMEKYLPDYLQVVSSNLKGGMSFEESLWTAIKPEFKVLAKEITAVSKKVMTGRDIKDSLMEFSEKYDSPTLKRAIGLILGEIESGGHITEVLDRLVDNMRETQELRDEMAASTLTYTIFIGAIVLFIAPALFALSYQLLHIIIGFSSQLSTIEAVSLPVKFSEVVLDPEGFRIFSVISIAIISVFASILITIIEKGEVKGGLKYIPMFLITTITIYFIALSLLSRVFSFITFG
jgi:pilus assembly protein TadC